VEAGPDRRDRCFIHATFLILLLWVALSDYLSDGSAAAAASGVLFVLAVFGAVVLMSSATR
jgi:hypothetical protein